MMAKDTSGVRRAHAGIDSDRRVIVGHVTELPSYKVLTAPNGERR